MSRIVFESERPIAQSDPVRADVACFVGLVRSLKGAALPPAVLDWLKLQGWVSGPFERTPPIDVPIPIENYAAFTSLFDAGGSDNSSGTDYVAASVRSFFAQGGKRCYVVSMGDPVSPTDTREKKQNALQSMLPATDYAADDQRGWHGAGHLSGLPDVSLLVMPDLPMLCASTPSGPLGQEPPASSGPVQFEECTPAVQQPTNPPTYGLTAPRLTAKDYIDWRNAVQTVLKYLSVGSLREMLFVVAFPMPQDTDVTSAQTNPANSVTQDLHDVIKTVMREPKSNDQVGLDIGISSAFLQLAYPWLKTTGSFVLLEGLEPPDGALAGILARNALVRGTFTSAVKIPPAEIYDVSTILPAKETTVPDAPLVWGDDSEKPLIERISLFGPTPSGLALLSDVTAYPGESYRPGRIHRLVAVILRAARTLGQQVAFDSNGPQLWRRVESSLQQLMMRLWRLNALDGATIQDAFSVRCDRSTMTQNDLDNGRLVANVTFNAASTIELIHITMALQTSGTSAQTSGALQEAG